VTHRRHFGSGSWHRMSLTDSHLMVVWCWATPQSIRCVQYLIASHRRHLAMAQTLAVAARRSEHHLGYTIACHLPGARACAQERTTIRMGTIHRVFGSAHFKTTRRGCRRHVGSKVDQASPLALSACRSWCVIWCIGSASGPRRGLCAYTLDLPNAWM
jgi:hypothetical protein